MNLVISSTFHKSMVKIAAKNPRLKKQITKTLKLLLVAPDHPSLRLHKLSNRQDYSISVNMSIRILVRFVDENIYLLAIGTHGQVY